MLSVACAVEARTDQQLILRTGGMYVKYTLPVTRTTSRTITRMSPSHLYLKTVYVLRSSTAPAKQSHAGDLSRAVRSRSVSAATGLPSTPGPL